MGLNLSLDKIISFCQIQFWHEHEESHKPYVWEGSREERQIQIENWVGVDRKGGIGRRAKKAIGNQGGNREFIKLNMESRLGEFLPLIFTLLSHQYTFWIIMEV